MKTKSQLIADSGGSNTTWIILNEDGTFEQFETVSLHPRRLKTMSESVTMEVRSKLAAYTQLKLTFYGAGCGNKVAIETTGFWLKECGFELFEIHPDTLAACRATLGSSPGFVAILGTGSVLMKYDGNAIIERKGGYGPIMGDEGSGIGFSKLLVRSALDSFPNWTEELFTLFGSEKEIKENLASTEVWDWLAQLSKKAAAFDFHMLHQRNIENFINAYLLDDAEMLHIVGSYGFSQKELIKEELVQRRIETGKISANPVMGLVAYHSKGTVI